MLRVIHIIEEMAGGEKPWKKKNIGYNPEDLKRKTESKAESSYEMHAVDFHKQICKGHRL